MTTAIASDAAQVRGTGDEGPVLAHKVELAVRFAQKIMVMQTGSGQEIMAQLARSSIIGDSMLRDDLESLSLLESGWWHEYYDGYEEDEGYQEDRADTDINTDANEENTKDKKSKNQKEEDSLVANDIPDSAFFVTCLILVLFFISNEPLPSAIVPHRDMTIHLKYDNRSIMVDGSDTLCYFDDTGCEFTTVSIDEVKRGLSLPWTTTGESDNDDFDYYHNNDENHNDDDDDSGRVV